MGGAHGCEQCVCAHLYTVRVCTCMCDVYMVCVHVCAHDCVHGCTHVGGAHVCVCCV